MSKDLIVTLHDDAFKTLTAMCELKGQTPSKVLEQALMNDAFFYKRRAEGDVVILKGKKKGDFREVVYKNQV